MPRQARLDSPGTLHHAICRGIEGREIVSDEHDRNNFVARMGHVAHDTSTEIYAWALMTNHIHILLRSGPQGISQFMRKLLTGFAISYNHRHERHGYLFQNRYKSIVCEEERYLLELVRYIHLNPIRAKIVNTLDELDVYPYCGHYVVMGKGAHKWQDWEYVLRLFGTMKGEARKEYRKFIEAGMGEGRRPDLVGGGLIRSKGGWSQVISMRRQGGEDSSDDRILGNSKFVERIIAEAEERQKRSIPSATAEKVVKKKIRAICAKEGISVSEVKGGSRRRQVSRIRMKIARELIEGHGIPMAVVAREVGVTTAAISKIMNALSS
jgi:REP element-mobilizing transposase RayT